MFTIVIARIMTTVECSTSAAAAHKLRELFLSSSTQVVKIKEEK
jgi:hypothetical protein